MLTQKINSKWGYINKDGKFVIEPKFATDPNLGYSQIAAGRFAGGLAVVEYPQRHRGIINKAGQSVFDNRQIDWEGNSVVHDGLMVVTSGASTPFGNGYFNTVGKLVAKCPSGHPEPFAEGYARFYSYQKNSDGKIGFYSV